MSVIIIGVIIVFFVVWGLVKLTSANQNYSNRNGGHGWG